MTINEMIYMETNHCNEDLVKNGLTKSINSHVSEKSQTMTSTQVTHNNTCDKRVENYYNMSQSFANNEIYRVGNIESIEESTIEDSFQITPHVNSIDSFHVNKNYSKKVTSLYHELNKSLKSMTINRVHKVDVDDTKLMIIDLNKNLFMIYCTINNICQRLEIDEKLTEHVFLSSYFSKTHSKLYLCDHESNFYELLLLDKTKLVLKQKFNIKNSGFIQHIEMDEIDGEKDKIYLCDAKINCIHEFKMPSSKTSEIKPKTISNNEICKPSYLKIKDNFLFVICKNDQYNQSHILIIDKYDTSLITKAILDGWLSPTGLYISKSFDLLLTTASKLNNNDDEYNSSDNEYLLVIDLTKYLYPKSEQHQHDYCIVPHVAVNKIEPCKILSEIELDFNLINDFYVLKNDKVLFLLNHADKPLVVVEMC